ncbi:MAG: phosphatase PAP2 family protein [Vicingaceae bacterium]
MIDLLEQWDRTLFLKLNSWHSPVGDQIMSFISGKVEWAPLYLILLVLLIVKYKRQSWWLLLAVGVAIALSDQISVKVFKEGFERFRPCHNLDLKEIVHLVNNKCGGKYGFVSSHASNSFSLATLLGLLLQRKTSKWALILLWFWAAVVSYSRIYLGVHYPSDVMGGALLGVLIGGGVYLGVKYTLFMKIKL